MFSLSSLRSLPPQLIGGVVGGLILGLLIGAGIGFQVAKKTSGTGQQTESGGIQTAQSSDTNDRNVPSGGQSVANGIYGRVLEKNPQSIIFRELFPPRNQGESPTEARFMTLVLPSNAIAIYQKEAANAKPGETPFTPEPGDLAAIQKDTYIYVEAFEDVRGTNTLTAKQIMYSEKNPF